MNLEAKIKGEIMTMKRFLLVLLCVAASCAWAKGTPKGLLIMIDGVRSDALFHAATPNLDGLIAGRWAPAYHGAYTGAAGAIPDADPNSAPNHVSILTGVTAARHGVTYNGKTRDGAYDKVPTILSRLSRHRPELSTLFAFAWGEDADIALLEDFPRMQNPDTVNAEKLSRLLGEANAPDLVVWYIDMPDVAGHIRNFYPHSQSYLNAIHLTDQWIGKVLAAIRNRKNFVDEDWLIAITADHGGYHGSHGLKGGHCSTIPIILASKNLPMTGTLPGRPGNVDLPVTMLAHFGASTDDLDGKKIGDDVEKAEQVPLRNGLVARLDFDSPADGPVLSGDKPPEALACGCFATSLSFRGQENVSSYFEWKDMRLKPPFTLTMWINLPAEQTGDSLIVSDKDWSDGANKGFAITASRKGDGAQVPGIFLNYGLKNRGRVDLGQFDIAPGQWSFLALSVTADGLVHFVNGGIDGRMYVLADSSPEAEFGTSDLPLVFGQDGTCRYPHNFSGILDDIGIWDRALSVNDLRVIFEAGRQGICLAEISSSPR